MRLQGKVALVTGGNSGIGLAIAQQFKNEGAKGAIIGRNQATLDAAIQELGADFIALKGDVTNVGDLEQVFKAAADKLGKLDVLVVSAGGAVEVGNQSTVLDTTEEGYDQSMDLNLKSVFFTVQKALPYLNDGASIVLIASTVARKAYAGMTVYSAAKAGVVSFAKSFSQDLLERRIRVNVVSPGTIETPIFDRLGLPVEAVAQVQGYLAGQIPLKRLGLASEIAAAATFLASDDSSFMLGSEVVVDGGATSM